MTVNNPWWGISAGGFWGGWAPASQRPTCPAALPGCTARAASQARVRQGSPLEVCIRGGWVHDLGRSVRSLLEGMQGTRDPPLTLLGVVHHPTSAAQRHEPAIF